MCFFFFVTEHVKIMPLFHTPFYLGSKVRCIYYGVELCECILYLIILKVCYFDCVPFFFPPFFFFGGGGI